VFREHGDLAIAQGHFTHVYVDRASQRPVPIPDAIRTAMAGLLA
jgi:acyl-CoA thioester hydrolase